MKKIASKISERDFEIAFGFKKLVMGSGYGFAKIF